MPQPPVPPSHTARGRRPHPGRPVPHGLALVTGATGGLGSAFARALPAETGLLLTGRNAGVLMRLQAELARPGRTVEVLSADLATDVGRTLLTEKAEVMGVDLVIHNAGVGRFGPVLGNPPEAERAIVELNVTAVTVLTRALLPGMIERAAVAGRRAGLVLVSSTLAFQPVPYLASYAATKSFLLSYGEALAAELSGRPVDVLVHCPGATRTGFGRRAGFALGALPGADAPDRVAAAALADLGRRTVRVEGMAVRAALGPVLWTRHAATGGLGRILSVFGPRPVRPDRLD